MANILRSIPAWVGLGIILLFVIGVIVLAIWLCAKCALVIIASVDILTLLIIVVMSAVALLLMAAWCVLQEILPEAVEQARQHERQTTLAKRTRHVQERLATNMRSDQCLEDILPSAHTSDHEAVARAISSIDSLTDVDKARLFERKSVDFVSRVLAYLTEAEQIAIIQQIEGKRREDVLMRYSLSQRSRIKSQLRSE